MYRVFDILRASGNTKDNLTPPNRVPSVEIAPETGYDRRKAISTRRSRHDFSSTKLTTKQLACLRESNNFNTLLFPIYYRAQIRIALLYRGTDNTLVAANDRSAFSPLGDVALRGKQPDLFIQSEFEQFDALIVPWVNPNDLVRELGIHAYMDALLLAGRYLESVWLDILPNDMYACMIAGIVKQEFSVLPGVGASAVPLAGLVIGNGSAGSRT